MGEKRRKFVINLNRIRKIALKTTIHGMFRSETTSQLYDIDGNSFKHQGSDISTVKARRPHHFR